MHPHWITLATDGQAEHTISGIPAAVRGVCSIAHVVTVIDPAQVVQHIMGLIAIDMVHLCVPIHTREPRKSHQA